MFGGSEEAHRLKAVEPYIIPPQRATSRVLCSNHACVYTVTFYPTVNTVIKVLSVRVAVAGTGCCCCGCGCGLQRMVSLVRFSTHFVHSGEISAGWETLRVAGSSMVAVVLYYITAYDMIVPYGILLYTRCRVGVLWSRNDLLQTVSKPGVQDGPSATVCVRLVDTDL